MSDLIRIHIAGVERPCFAPCAGGKIIPRIVIYEVIPTGHRFVQSFELGDKLEEDGDEDKLAPKLDAIRDCAIVYVAAIGGSGAARVVARKIHPIKVPEPEAIAQILHKLQVVLSGTPPPWLRKALARDNPRAFDFEDQTEAQHG